MKKKYSTVLTIAGSDSGGGAGIQADIKAISAMGCYAASAITAITVQNTMGVQAVHPVPLDILAGQIDAVLSDIGADAVKIGMGSSAPLIKVIASKLKEYNAKVVVVDPVMVATSGSSLLESEATSILMEELFPMATVLTPNIEEAQALSGIDIHSHNDMIKAAKKIGDAYNCAVLCKGGHSLNDANDVLYINGDIIWFEGERVDNPNTHGTGCTLASAIASNLAKGFDLNTSIQRSKDYITDAMKAGLNLGQGSGPLNHGFGIQSKYTEGKNHASKKL